MEHIKRVGRELMYKGSMLEFYKDTIVTPDGKTAYWDHIEHKGAAAVVAVRDDGRIIMVRQFRNSPDKETLEIPAGGIKENELPVEAALRELHEETGYDSMEKPIELGCYYVNPSVSNNCVYTFLLRNAYKRFEQETDETEEIEIMTYDFEQIEDLIGHGEITQLFSISAILMAKNYINAVIENE